MFCTLSLDFNFGIIVLMGLAIVVLDVHFDRQPLRMMCESTQKVKIIGTNEKESIQWVSTTVARDQEKVGVTACNNCPRC